MLKNGGRIVLNALEVFFAGNWHIHSSPQMTILIKSGYLQFLIL